MTESSGKHLQIELEGTFDSAQIERILRDVGSVPGQPVTLDFGKVEHLHDSALAILARALVDGALPRRS